MAERVPALSSPGQDDPVQSDIDSDSGSGSSISPGNHPGLPSLTPSCSDLSPASLPNTENDKSLAELADVAEMSLVSPNRAVATGSAAGKVMKSRTEKGEKRELFLPFLIRKLDEGSTTGLSWVDKEEHIMRIRWVHMKSNDYVEENDASVFRDWAINTGKYCANKNEPSRWKINFRSALNTMRESLQELKRNDIARLFLAKTQHVPQWLSARDYRYFRIFEGACGRRTKQTLGFASASTAFSPRTASTAAMSSRLVMDVPGAGRALSPQATLDNGVRQQQGKLHGSAFKPYRNGSGVKRKHAGEESSLVDHHRVTNSSSTVTESEQAWNHNEPDLQHATLQVVETGGELKMEHRNDHSTRNSPLHQSSRGTGVYHDQAIKMRDEEHMDRSREGEDMEQTVDMLKLKVNNLCTIVHTLHGRIAELESRLQHRH
ncbi:uncharacterized protein LOC135805154 isoform X2 [Sycon ciliatum]|uniref:uncharacterized protein LOC135805154 isoform X2 n=1 Tax=Sycon ciliatum TaxID=27933 RepID=UPI0020ADD7AF|eukprot:scpid61781/ scgid17797/ Interferon regulatory factor 2